MHPATPRPRRSALYMPGANARALDKARGLDADVLILDLEDAVAPDAKPQARAQVAAALRAGGYGRRECVARINALDTPWGLDDARALAAAGADAVLLPKVESPAQLDAGAGIDAAGAPADLPLWAMCETPLGFLRLDAIAGHPRLAALVVGTSDLVKDLHARHTPGREETLLARSLAVMAARAHGLAALDGVHLDLDDEAGLALACEQGRNQGFDGKTLIHPRQIAAANAAYAPSPGDRRRAQAVAGLARCPGQRPGRRGGRRFAGGKPARARSRTRAGAGRCHRRRLSAPRARPHPYRRASPATALPRRPGTIRFLTRTTPRFAARRQALRRAVPRAGRLNSRPEPHALHPATRAVSRAAVPRRPAPFPLRP